MRKLLHSLWQEPRAPLDTDPRFQDAILLTVIATLTITEGLFRPGLEPRIGVTLATLVMLATLALRRTHPSQMVFLAFGINTVLQTSARLLEFAWTNMASTIFLLILPYSLLRWGSGREAVAGIGYIYMTYALTIGQSETPLNEQLAGILFLLFSAALGASARYRNAAAQSAKEQILLREREQLARELHDTVAHHVSAIAIQAQAGRALAHKEPQAPLEALKTIEVAASNTLNEMRRLVRAMRSEDQADLAPSATIADIDALAQNTSYPLTIYVNRSGSLRDIDTALQSTLFRLAQESITNAVRHAQGAKRVTINLVGNQHSIDLAIENDGNLISKTPSPGLGLQGMSERTALLGGKFSAGPTSEGGWIVKASLPREDSAQ